MWYLRLTLWSLAILGYAVWVGGFTFYSAVVLWVIHAEYGSFDAGKITQQVTYWLNWIGVGTLVIWWLVAWLEHHGKARFVYGLLGLSTGLLIFLFVDHWVLNQHLEEQGLSGFYPYHRIYLIASTIQWTVNLLLIPCVILPRAATHNC